MFVIYIFLLLFLFTNCVIDDHEGHQGNTDNLSKGLKSYPRQFSRFPYYENLQIVHLFDTMHIRKNVIEMLWKILDGRHDKEKLAKICSVIHDSIHAMKISLNQIAIKT